MNKKKLIREEFIGLKVNIHHCNDPTWIGKSGIIINETKNMFEIRIDNKNKKIGKKNSKFVFEDNENKIILNGSKIAYRPEDRIKKAR